MQLKLILLNENFINSIVIDYVMKHYFCIKYFSYIFKFDKLSKIVIVCVYGCILYVV